VRAREASPGPDCRGIASPALLKTDLGAVLHRRPSPWQSRWTAHSTSLRRRPSAQVLRWVKSRQHYGWDPPQRRSLFDRRCRHRCGPVSVPVSHMVSPLRQWAWQCRAGPFGHTSGCMRPCEGVVYAGLAPMTIVGLFHHRKVRTLTESDVLMSYSGLQATSPRCA
jgi:hypothetical protein